jgi:chromosome segregation ATPase
VLVSQFLGYEANIAAMQTQIQSYKSQIVELEQRREKEVEKLTVLRRKVAACRPQCESLLSAIVKREVRITGDINKL